MSLQGLNFLRSSPHLRVVSFIGAVCFLSALTLVSVRAQTLGDSTPVLKTSEILRGHMLSGPGYGVDATVRNDGLMNIFRVTVDRKTYTVMSNVIMRQRLQELVALQRMEALARSDVYKNAGKSVV